MCEREEHNRDRETETAAVRVCEREEHNRGRDTERQRDGDGGGAGVRGRGQALRRTLPFLALPFLALPFDLPLSEKGVRLAHKMHVGPCIAAEIQL